MELILFGSIIFLVGLYFIVLVKRILNCWWNEDKDIVGTIVHLLSAIFFICITICCFYFLLNIIYAKL